MPSPALLNNTCSRSSPCLIRSKQLHIPSVRNKANKQLVNLTTSCAHKYLSLHSLTKIASPQRPVPQPPHSVFNTYEPPVLLGHLTIETSPSTSPIMYSTHMKPLCYKTTTLLALKRMKAAPHICNVRDVTYVMYTERNKQLCKNAKSPFSQPKSYNTRVRILATVKQRLICSPIPCVHPHPAINGVEALLFSPTAVNSDSPLQGQGGRGQGCGGRS